MGSEQPSQPQSTLRRRMQILERAHSLSGHGHSISSNLPKNTTKTGAGGVTVPKEDQHEEETAQSLTDYETGSESSRSELDNGVHENDDESNIHVGEETLHKRPAVQEYDVSHSPPKQKSWYEFDLAVIAALVSPIGNWLTGGDHIKDLILVLLLIFYLHQVIEVPWHLYHSSRPRRNVANMTSRDAPEERYQRAAASELRLLEFLFLILTIISPLIGAVLLRWVTSAVLGADIHSWFSTSLFVLATGMRPWSHLIQRLTQRVTDLHDIVHYPSSKNPSADEVTRQVEELRKQAEFLEAALNKIRHRMLKDTEEVYEYVDGAVDSVEKALKRHERKCEKQDGKMKDLEVAVNGLKTRRPKISTVKIQDTPPQSRLLHFLPTRLHLALSAFFPSWLVTPTPETIYEQRSSPSSTVTRYSLPSLSSPDGLEPIPEESLVGTGAGNIKETSQPLPGLGTRLFLRLAYLALFPLRSLSRMIFGYS